MKPVVGTCSQKRGKRTQRMSGRIEEERAAETKLEGGQEGSGGKGGRRRVL